MEYLIQLGLAGLKRVLAARSFTSSSRVEAELKEYEETNNPIISFFNEVDENEIVNEPTNKVYRKYNEFCINNNFTPMSNIEFSRKVVKYFDLEIKRKMIDRKNYKIYASKS